MFQALRYLYVFLDVSGYDAFKFELVDSKFRRSFTVKNRGRTHLIAKIVSIYKDAGFPVASNVAAFYASLIPKYAKPVHIEKFKKDIVADADFLDIYYPHLYYTKMYLPCVKRHIKASLWAKGFV